MIPREMRPLAVIGGAGLALMWIAKVPDGNGVESWYSAIAALIAILLVAVWYAQNEGEYDLERAGDGAYYLGLIYTLASLVYTLATQFGGEEAGSASRVIPAFGIALSSTAGGVVARIWLQAKAAEADEHRGARIEAQPLTPERLRGIYGDALAVAAQRVTGEIRRTIDQLARLGREATRETERMRAHARESGRKATEDLDKAFKGATEAVQRMHREIGRTQDAIRTAGERGVQEMAKLQEEIRAGTEKANAQAEQAAEKHREEIRKLHEATRREAEEVHDAVSQMRSAAEALTTACSAITETARALEITLKRERLRHTVRVYAHHDETSVDGGATQEQAEEERHTRVDGTGQDQESREAESGMTPIRLSREEREMWGKGTKSGRSGVER